MSPSDPPTVDLDTLPLQPLLCMHVLALILRRHNWQHAVKDKNIGHRTAQSRGRLCVWVFRFLHHNPVKAFKLEDQRDLPKRSDAAPFTAARSIGIIPIIVILIVILIVLSLLSRCSRCDPRVENCSSTTARSSGGSWGGSSCGGGHK